VIVLGIDPGTARLGYGLVAREGSTLSMVDYGCLETIRDRPPEQRLLIIHEGLTELIREHHPISDVSAALGHTSVLTTAKYYLHADPEMIRQLNKGR
jgi:crossover junction endodeoxyribonuclease RuvC